LGKRTLWGKEEGKRLVIKKRPFIVDTTWGGCGGSGGRGGLVGWGRDTVGRGSRPDRNKEERKQLVSWGFVAVTAVSGLTKRRGSRGDETHNKSKTRATFPQRRTYVGVDFGCGRWARGNNEQKSQGGGRDSRSSPRKRAGNQPVQDRI